MSSLTTTTRRPFVRAALSAMAALVLAATGLGADEKSAAKATFTDTGPVAVSRERQFDFTSAINGQPYRLMISAPKAEPGKRYPVLFVLDGNWYFRAASDTATWGSGPFDTAIVVGIGYPTEDYAEVRRRRGIDLSVKEQPERFPTGSGGCDTFLRIVEQEIKPFVASRFAVDSARYMLYGKSLGGLAVVRAMLRTPENFSTYLVISPSIWQGDNAVLADEPVFSEKARTGKLNLRILITSASEEEYLGPDAAKRAADLGKMITNARGLADRIGKLNPDKLIVRYAIFQDESHNTVSLASIARAITFALPAPPAPNQKKKSKQ
ncbi:MAG: alpha/beta hydrolase [Verrucomicrobia bacterium]|nr:alpha/beta hydrolase [Verrucomicrobiota bacterium]